MFRIITVAGLACALAACAEEAATEQPTEAAEAAPDATPKFAQLDQGLDTPFPGHATQIVVGKDDLPARLALLEVEVAPRSIGAPPHRHSQEDEVFIVTDGAVTFLNGEEEVEASAGTVASLPRGHFHGFWNPHDEPARMLLAIAPGEFDDFFDEVVQQIRTENADDPDSIGRIIAQAADARGVTVDPSRFPASAQELMGPPPG